MSREELCNGSADAAASLNVGIVHEWLTNRAGSERCVEALVDLFPESRVYTSLIAGSVFPDLVSRTVSTRLQRRFGHEFGHLKAAPLLPLAMRSLRTASGHDLAIYSFHHFATWASFPDNPPTIVYCYTPPRFIYRSASMVGERGLAMGVARGVRPLAKALDRYHLVRRRRPVLVGISTAVARRIGDSYDVDARVVHPPVAVDGYRGHLRPEGGGYYLFVGRLVPYKRAELAVAAFEGEPHELVVVGEGRDRQRLESQAPANVRFVGRVTDAEMADLYAGAEALIFPGEEDFGLVPVEAMAAGCPVIAARAGGALDYVVEGLNGTFLESATCASIRGAMGRLRAAQLDRQAVSDSTLWLAPESFHSRMSELALEVVGER